METSAACIYKEKEREKYVKFKHLQGLLEGLKAYRTEDDRLMLFRPEENARRMQMGAARICMPSPSAAQFVQAVKKTVLANKRWVPPPSKGSLYLRPLIIGSGPVLGVAPAKDYIFLIYASPYFKGGNSPLNLFVDDMYHYAASGGVGGVKTNGNYAPTQAKSKGFSDVLFLDSVNNRCLEEVSTSNIFIVKDNVISTPPLQGTILPGITRKSTIEIALKYDYQVEERPIPVEELSDADEAFCTGTAAVVAPVSSITYHDERVEYRRDQAVSHQLYSALTSIQMGLVEDTMGWTVEID